MSSVDAGIFEPKDVGSTLGAMWRACVSHSGAAIVTVVAMLLPVTAVQCLGQYMFAKSGLMDLLKTMQSGQFDPTTIDWGSMIVDIAIVGALLGGAGIVAFIIAYAGAAAVARMMAERALGRDFGPAAAWDFVLSRLFRFIGGAFVLMFVLIAAYVVLSIPMGIIALVIGKATGQLQMQPGAQPSPLMQIVPLAVIGPVMCILVVYLVSMAPAAGIEDTGPIGAIFRSFRLVPGNFGHVFAVIIISGLILLAPSGALQYLMQNVFMDTLQTRFGDASGALIASLPPAIVGLILAPFMYALQAVIYFDLRSRRLEEDFAAYELALDVGGELPEGVVDPLLGPAAPSSPMSDVGSTSDSDVS